MALNTPPTTQITDAQKRIALEGFLHDQQRVHCAEAMPEKAKQAMLVQLVDVLLADEHLCGNVLHNQVQFMLHNQMAQGAPSYELKTADHDIIVHVAPDADQLDSVIRDSVKAALNEKEVMAAEQDPATWLSKKGDGLSGEDLIIGSGFYDEGKPNGMHHGAGGSRSPYDPRVESLAALGYDKKHTAGQLKDKALARIGVDRNGNPDPGGHWLWQVEYDYVLSDEALQSKKPGRWFRDICVMCGVPTIVLEGLTGRTQGGWSEIQNHKTQKPAHHIMQALSIMLPRAVHAGKGRGYDIPPGSLFALPTIEQQQPDGSIRTLVDPKALERIHQALFDKPMQTRECMERGLRFLSHLSLAYMAGAIKPEEIAYDSAILKDALQPIFQRYGYDAVYPHRSTQYHAISNLVNSNECPGAMKYVTETLAAINDKHWHIPRQKFSAYMHDMLRLPRKTCYVGEKIPPEEAFVFAQNHHNGKIEDFLRCYREASSERLINVADRLGYSHEAIRRIEAGLTGAKTAVKRALQDSNPWALPEDEHGQIRVDVKEYLDNLLHKRVKRQNKESFWLEPQEALEQFAGIEYETHGQAAFKEFRDKIYQQAEHEKDKPFFLATLAGGHEVLVKQEKNKEPQLYAGDLGVWLQSAMRDYAHQTRDTALEDESLGWAKRMRLGRGEPDPSEHRGIRI